MRSPLSPAGCASARRSSANPFPAFTPQVSRFSTKTGESLSHKLTSATSHLVATYCFSEKVLTAPRSRGRHLRAWGRRPKSLRVAAAAGPKRLSRCHFAGQWAFLRENLMYW